jgi:hypothetical protein
MSKHGVLDTNMVNCVPSVSKIPFIEFAYLSNSAVEDSISSVFKFNPVSLSWIDFNNLFFTPGNNFFHINPANANSQALSFNQTYQEFTNKNVLFNLSKSILNAWAVKHNLSVDSIPTYKKLELTKQLYLANNLVSVRGHVQGLSLHECMYSLFKNGEIEPSNDDTATVDFVLVYKFLYAPLETSIQTEFKYRVKIPGYKSVMKVKNQDQDVADINQSIPDSECIPYYSDDSTPSRKLASVKAKNAVFEMKDDSSETSELKSFHNDDDEHTISQSANIIHDVNQLIQGLDTYSDSGNNSDAGNTTHTNIKW